MKVGILIIALLCSTSAAVYFYNVGATESPNDNSKLLAEVERLKKDNERLANLNKGMEKKLSKLETKTASLEELVVKTAEVKRDKKKEAEALEKTEEVQEEEPELSPREQERRAQMQKFLMREIEKNYASVFESMNLSEDMIAGLKDKLVERDSEIVSAVFKSILQSLPTEEGQTQEQALAKSILDSIEKTNTEIASDLGDAFGEFREQEQRGYTLRELSNFEGILGDNSLGDEQRVGLNDLMYEHHNSVLQSVAAGETTFKQADESLVEKSSEFLNEDQRKSLSSYLKMKRGGN